MTGESEGVAAVVGGIVDGIGMGKPYPEHKKRAEQDRRQCRNYGSLRLGPHKGLTCLVHYSIPCWHKFRSEFYAIGSDRAKRLSVYTGFLGNLPANVDGKTNIELLARRQPDLKIIVFGRVTGVAACPGDGKFEAIPFRLAGQRQEIPFITGATGIVLVNIFHQE